MEILNCIAGSVRICPDSGDYGIARVSTLWCLFHCGRILMLSRSRKHGKDDVAFEILGRLNKCAPDDPTIADEVREIKRVATITSSAS